MKIIKIKWFSNFLNFLLFRHKLQDTFFSYKQFGGERYLTKVLFKVRNQEHTLVLKQQQLKTFLYVQTRKNKQNNNKIRT